jgi:multidrug efflux pump subunit AcrA (membrane-fusion protein)
MSKDTTRRAIDLNALDHLLDSLAKTAGNSSTNRSDFYASINKNIVACTESKASAILVSNQDGRKVRLVHKVGWEELASNDVTAFQKCIQSVLTGEVNSVSVSLPSSRAFIGKCKTQKGMQFVYALLRNLQDNELESQVFTDLANEIASQIKVFEDQLASGEKPKSILNLTHIAQLVQNLGKSKNTTQMAFHLVNDLARITQSDRVSFVDKWGKVQAVNGASRVSLRTSSARRLSSIARLTLASGNSIEWTGEEVQIDGPRSTRGLKQLVLDLGTAEGFVIPVESDSSACGVLVVEYFDSGEQTAMERRALVSEVVNFASPVVERSMRVSSIPGIGILDTVFNRLLSRPVRLMAFLAALGAGIALLGFCLFGIQRPFEIYGEGVLQTATRQHVFAGVDGEIEELLVREGGQVEHGERLAVVGSESLEKELISIEGEIAEAKQEMRNLKLSDFRQDEETQDDATKRASDIERLKLRLKTLDARMEFFENQKSQLEIEAPIGGQVITPNLQQRLASRPVNRGDLLMTIANTSGEWEIELQVPDNRVGFIKQAQTDNDGEPLEVIFRLASDSEKTFSGTLNRLDYRSDLRSLDEESVVLAYVDISESDLGGSLRLGSRVYGKVVCGQRNNFFLLTYEARNKIREWFFH